jgi:hypothetical protein
MSQADRITSGADARFHPVSHYNSPADVLEDEALSASEKRVILSSWASDMYAVDSQPALREIPGIGRPMRLADILAALRQLDGPSLSTSQSTPTADVRPRIEFSPSRWSREANVTRYRRLLATKLTQHERDFVERRLTEELAARDGPAARIFSAA